MPHHSRASSSQSNTYRSTNSSRESSPPARQDIGTPIQHPYRHTTHETLWIAPKTSPGSHEQEQRLDQDARKKQSSYDNTLTHRPENPMLLADEMIGPAIDTPPESSGTVASADRASGKAPVHQITEEPSPGADIRDHGGLGLMIPERSPLRPSSSAGLSNATYKSIEKTQSRKFERINPRARDMVEEQFIRKEFDHNNEDEDDAYVRLSPYRDPRLLKSTFVPRREPLCLSPEGSVCRNQMVGEKEKELQRERQKREHKERVYEELRRDRMGKCYPPALREFRDAGFWEIREHEMQNQRAYGSQQEVTQGTRFEASREWDEFVRGSKVPWYRWGGNGSWCYRIMTSTDPGNEGLQRLIKKTDLRWDDAEDESQKRRKSSVGLKHDRRG